MPLKKAYSVNSKLASEHFNSSDDLAATQLCVQEQK